MSVQQMLNLLYGGGGGGGGGGIIKPQSNKNHSSEKYPHNMPVMELINWEKHHPSKLKEKVNGVKINFPMCTPFQII